jgi:hypothetical protein
LTTSSAWSIAEEGRADNMARYGLALTAHFTAGEQKASATV